jgi:hypothetical protein
MNATGAEALFSAPCLVVLPYTSSRYSVRRVDSHRSP